MRVRALSTLRTDGSVMFVAEGVPPNVYVFWTKVSGPGTLTQRDNYSDERGVASAVWTPSGATAGADVRVRASYYA